jgi:hypothetical protein
MDQTEDVAGWVGALEKQLPTKHLKLAERGDR